MFKNFVIFATLIANYISFTSSSTINCVYSGQGNPYICDAETVTAVTSENEAITITGTHQQGLDANNVDYLYFIDGHDVLNFVPTKIFDVFQNLNTIAIYESHVNTMTTNAFIKCSSLKIIDINRNSFPLLPASIAESCTNLEVLNLYQNEIQTVHKDSLKGLTNLKRLWLHMNNITFVDPETFKHTPNISEIVLYYNQITEIHPKTFAGLKNLVYIDLAYNYIKVLPALDLTDSLLLDKLYFHYGKISAIDPNFSVSSYPATRTIDWILSLSYNECVDSIFDKNHVMSEINMATCYDNFNKLTTVAPKTSDSGSCTAHRDCRYFLDENKKYTCVLESVDLILTSIGGLHDAGFADSDVTYVFFDNSSLSKVPRIIFDKFVNLEFVSIRETGITEINDHTFEVCGSLKKLDASYNEITRVSGTSLRKCQLLEWFDLTGNLVEDLEIEMYELNKNLKHVIFNRRIPALS